MTTQQKIAAILKQDNYRVENGKVLRYDQLEDKFKPVMFSGNRIPLVKTGSVVEIFMWDDVKSVVDGWDGAAWKISGDIHGHEMKTMGTVDVLNFPIHTKNKELSKVIVKPKKQIMAKKAKEKKAKPSSKKKQTKKYVSLTEENISFINKEHKKGTSKMAIARMLSEKTGQDVTRFIVMYHVKKIDAKKK